jgi:predicted ATPase
VAAAIVKTLRVIVLAEESPEQAVERFLAAKQLLLVADNFEHLLDAAPFIGGLLGACPALTVLVTSREPLALQAEERYPVDGLTGADAVTLFCERARAHGPGSVLGDDDMAAVAAICRRVDGLPLAIELAAARCALLSPSEIAERMDAALAAPGTGVRDAPARQQTLRATIDWSHALLSEEEQRCFARFSVFAGGATVEAAEAVTGAGLDMLTRLVTKSLVVHDRHGHSPTRLWMLDTIRSYAAEHFAAAADADAVRECHYRYYLGLAQCHGDDRVVWGTGGHEHLATLDADLDNLHAALVWTLAEADAERALDMVAALGRYWLMRDRYSDAIAWIDQALNLPGAEGHPALRVRALSTKDSCLWAVGRRAEQPAVVAMVEAIARRLGDPVILSKALQLRVMHEINLERLDAADAHAVEALYWAKAAGNEWEIAEASRGQAIAASNLADLRERVDGAAALLDEVGNIHQLAHLLTSAAYAALCLGSERDAADFAARASPIARELESRFVRMLNSGNLGLAALLTGETDTASRAFREELTLCREMVVRSSLFEGLRGLAAVAVVDGDAERAATLVGAADAHRYDLAEDAVEARLDQEFFAPARTRSASDTWNDAAREGSLLSAEDAIAYALVPCPRQESNLEPSD